jgi:Rrf2 family protein
MATSTRFAVGVHLLTALAANPGQVIRSEQIACSVNTNPAVVRRLFSILAQAGLVRARLGQGGGFELARPPAEVTLLDVYRALEEPELFATHRSPPDPGCPVGRHILAELEVTTRRAQVSLEAELRATTIADVVLGVLHRATDEDRAACDALRN